VFIHGPGPNGHPAKSWTTEMRSNEAGPVPRVFWPLDLLPVDFPACRILTFGYNDSDPLSDISFYLLSSLEQVRLASPLRPIVFIVHSLGGVVLKKVRCFDLTSNLLRLSSKGIDAQARTPDTVTCTPSHNPSSFSGHRTMSTHRVFPALLG